jgi:hypothetical protein
MAITKENAWEIVDRAVRGNVITGIRDGNKVRRCIKPGQNAQFQRKQLVV